MKCWILNDKVAQDADAVVEGEEKQESIEVRFHWEGKFPQEIETNLRVSELKVLEDGPDVNFYQPERKEPETPYVVYRWALKQIDKVASSSSIMNS